MNVVIGTEAAQFPEKEYKYGIFLAGIRQIVSKMKWACLATPLLLLGLVEARQVEVEDVTARQLEAATQTEDVLAVFWCKYTS
jgi:hypothetical protein